MTLLLTLFAITGDSWLAVIGVVLAALITLYGVIYTARQSRKAQQSATTMENRAVDAEAYERARESYEAAIATYLEEITRLQNRVASLNNRIEEKDNEVHDLKKERSGARYDAEAMREYLIEQRREHEDHLRRCARRLRRLQDRLKDGHISADDPDLQLEP